MSRLIMSRLISSRFTTSRLIALLALLIAPGAINAQSWAPDRNVELIVPAGGSIDLLARALQRSWTDQKMVPVPVSLMSKPGGGHAVAYNYLAQHAGSTGHVQIMSSNLLTGHITGRMKTSYKDFTPIALLVDGAYYGLAVKVDSPLKTAKDLVDALRKDPASVNVALGTALGASHHVAFSLMMLNAGVDVPKTKLVSFQDSAKVVTAVLGGHVDVGTVSAINAIPHLEAGTLRLLAISAPKRMAGPLAGVATWQESGYKGVIGSWRGLIGPKGMTPAQVAFWDGVAKRTTEDPQFRKFAEGVPYDITYVGSSGVAKWLAEEHEELRRVLAGIGFAK